MSISLDPFASSGLHPVAEALPAHTSAARQRLVGVLGSGRRGAPLRAAIVRALAEAFACEASALLSADAAGWRIAAGAATYPPAFDAPRAFHRLHPLQRQRFLQAVAEAVAAPAAGDAERTRALTLVAPVLAEDGDLLGYVALGRTHDPFTPDDHHALAAVKALLTPAFAPPVRPHSTPSPRRRHGPPPDPARFLADVAHTMRNHLNALHGFVELVASGSAGRIAPHQRQLLAYAHASSIELTAYIENLLYLTRLDAGQAPLSLETISLRELLDDVAQYFALEATAGKIKLTPPPRAALPAICADRLRLRQAVMNVVSNAIKFTPEGGRVCLQAEVLPDHARITVSDSGPGIDSADLPYLGERGFVAERTAGSGKNGSGLGLAAAKAIATQHGGALICANSSAAGATWIVTIPR